MAAQCADAARQAPGAARCVRATTRRALQLQPFGAFARPAAGKWSSSLADAAAVGITAAGRAAEAATQQLQQQQQQGAAAASPPPKAAAGRPGDEYFSSDTRPIILFDGVCNLCNRGVNFVLDAEAGPAFRFAALQSAAGRALLARAGRAPDDISSIVLVERDAAYVKSAAVLRIGRALRLPLAQLAALGALSLPAALADAAYDWLADNRYRLFGRAATCRLSDPRAAGRFRSD
eukprot:scaffold5.g739.t1